MRRPGTRRTAFQPRTCFERCTVQPSKKDFKELPISVQKDMGVALFVVQLGRTPESSKPWKELGSGVYELVEDYPGDAFRAVYTVRFAGVVYVLHAFQKKAKKGISTPPQEIEKVKARLKLAEQEHVIWKSRNP